MSRTILTYGLISGVIILLGILATIVFNPGGHSHGSVWLGYLIMLIGLSSILLAVKSHRDNALGGVIKFWPAFLIGLGVAIVATIAYAAVWEVYLALTHYRFMDEYADSMLAQKRAAGVSGAEYAQLVAQMDEMKKSYANPLFRVPMTMAEIAPVGLLVALVSAALVRNPKFLPSRV
jgi:hypothetical protein